MRIKVGGGHAGHNGLRSLIARLGTPDFVRVRVGVGRPSTPGVDKDKVTGHVLGPFSRAEQKDLPAYLDQAADAVEAILERGLTHAMNHFNK